MIKPSIEISLAPLQGLTDYACINLFNAYFKGVDKYYTPFIRLQNDKTLKSKDVKNVLPENNTGINLIPQILTNNATDFIYLAHYLQDLGYLELNWNLGCPYPMVTNKQMGSGLLPFPEIICTILEEVFPKTNLDISIKMRNGLVDNDSIIQLLPRLDAFPLKEIIIHPRYGKQMYKGEADMDMFQKCIPLSNHKMAYNGDINDRNSFQQKSERCATVQHFMVGRGLLSNPFLAEEIKELMVEPSNHRDRFFTFHDALQDNFESHLSGPGHLLQKMKGYWEYFYLLFQNDTQVFKRIKKAKTIEKFNDALQFIRQNEILNSD